jgi:hypothetical protein
MKEYKLIKVEKIKAEKGFKIKIISSTADDWYSNRIGRYYVIDTIGQSSYYISDGRYINKKDCEVFKPMQDHIVEPNKKIRQQTKMDELKFLRKENKRLKKLVGVLVKKLGGTVEIMEEEMIEQIIYSKITANNNSFLLTTSKKGEITK